MFICGVFCVLEKVIVCSIFYGFLQLSLFICIKSFKDYICEVKSKVGPGLKVAVFAFISN